MQARKLLRQKKLFQCQYDAVAEPQPEPPHSGSSTSRAAAEAIKPKAGSQRRALFEFLQQHPDGLTDDEQQQGLRLSGNSQRPRRRELQKAGLVTDSGRRRDGKIVWQAVATPQS